MGGRGGSAVNGSTLKSGEGNNCVQGIAKGNNGNKDQLSSAIPAGVKKIVQSLKEVVNNFSESEIYAALKECNMDPNETVSRLLTQGTFHEVKSKRDKKKEQNKDSSETRPRPSNNSGYRGGKTGAERNFRASSAQFSSTEPVILPVKSNIKKENGIHSGLSSSSATANAVNRRVPISSNHSTADRLPQPEFSYPSSGSMWRLSGQVSMADVVKLGRPHSKPYDSTNQIHNQTTSFVPPQKSSEVSSSKIPEMNWEPNEPPTHHFETNGEWPSIEQPPVLAKADVSSEEHYPDSPNGDALSPDQNADALLPEPNADEPAIVSASSRALRTEDSADRNVFISTNAFNSFDNETPDVITGVQQLSLKETLEKGHHSVIIPNHLQVHSEDCSHLSFGSFSSPNFPSQSFKSKPEESLETADNKHSDLQEQRSASFYRDDQPLEDTTLKNSSSVSEPKEESPEPSQANQYSYSYETTPHLPASFTNPENAPQLPINYMNNAPRKADLPYSPFPMTQAAAVKNLSMSEALRAATISAAQTSADAATAAPALLQQLAMHPFSQPTLPLGPFSNMIGYPFLPQSYTYMPSGFPGNSSYHQSLAAMLPHYKNSVSVSSLPQSPSGYAFPSSNSGNAYQPASYEDILSSHFKEANHLVPQQQSEWGNMRGNAGYYNMQGQSVAQGRQSPQVAYPNYYSAVDHQHQHQHQQQHQLQNGRDGQPSNQLWQSSY